MHLPLRQYCTLLRSVGFGALRGEGLLHGCRGLAIRLS
jgi:hypothetical protein